MDNLPKRFLSSFAVLTLSSLLLFIRIGVDSASLQVTGQNPELSVPFVVNFFRVGRSGWGWFNVKVSGLFSR